MIKLISQSIINNFVEKKVINQEDESIYAYGTEIAVAYILNLIAIFIIAAMMDMLIYCIIFIMIFVPLKSYTGGYHASNYKSCFILSCLIVTVVLFITKNVPFKIPTYILILTMALSGALVYIIGPIEDQNKSLTKIEFVYYKGKIKSIVIIELIVAVFISLFGFEKILFLFCCNFIIALGVSIAGVIKNKLLIHSK